MAIFNIKKILIEKSYDGKYLTFSGEFRKRLFFGSNENGEFKIINNSDFYEFEQEHILKFVNDYLKK